MLLGISLMIISGFIFNSKSRVKISAVDKLAQKKIEHVTIAHARKMIEEEDDYIFVDLRSPYDFHAKHIKNAIPMSIANLLDKENLNLFKEYYKSGKTTVIYGKTEREAIAPCILLYQLGFTNVKVLSGGFDCFTNENTDCPNEAAMYNYAEIAEQGGVKEVKVVIEKPKELPKAKKVIPVVEKVKVEQEGGC